MDRPAIAIILALALGGCTAAEIADRAVGFGGRDVGYASSPTGNAIGARSDAGASAPTAAGGEAPAASEAPAAAKRLIIYTARFELLVANAEEAMDRFLRKVEAIGGHLQLRENNAISCRVPAERFQSLVAEIPSFGAVISRSQEALDVTKEHRDLAIRIENADRQRKRLLALLEKADKMEDILKIEADLRRLTEEIEKMQAEIRSLEDRVAFSTIDILCRSSAPEARSVRSRKPNPFDWINRVGPEKLLDRY